MVFGIVIIIATFSYTDLVSDVVFVWISLQDTDWVSPFALKCNMDSLWNLVDNKGNTSSVRDLRGKIIGIYFSAHWCPPCRRFTPVLARIYQYHPTSLLVLLLHLHKTYSMLCVASVYPCYVLCMCLFMYWVVCAAKPRQQVCADQV